jgi:predicted permease
MRAIDTALQDLRFALRMMRKSPGFTAVALLSLAFGIGTNSAIFSVVDALLLKSLPVAAADQLMILAKHEAGRRMRLFSYPAYRSLEPSAATPASACSGVIASTESSTAVVRPFGAAAGSTAAASAPTASAPSGPTAAGPAPASSGAGAEQAETAETAEIQLVSGSYFPVLGVGMAAGRPFTVEEDTPPQAHAVAVASYGYWQRRFGRDPGVVGRTLLVNGVPVTVVGVARRGFRGVRANDSPDLFLPVALRDALRYRGSTHTLGNADPELPTWNQPNVHWLEVIARRRPEVTLERAAAELGVLFEREKRVEEADLDAAELRDVVRTEKLLVEPGGHGTSGLRLALARPLLILMVVAGLVLVIACANVANLLLARADRRRKEMAVRLGVGAGRGRLMRQLATESLLLAGLGGALGLLFAGWGSRLLLGLLSRGAAPIPLDVDLDWRKVAFALAVAFATGLGFGLAPALQATRVDLSASLKQGAGVMRGHGAAGAGGGRRRGRMPLGRVLVAAQLGLSLLLLIGAGLFVRSLRNLLAVDAGFAAEGVVTASIDPRLLGLSDARLLELYRRLVDRLEAIPGVRSASLSEFRPLSDDKSTGDVFVDGYAPRRNEDMRIEHLFVTPRYFETMGIGLRAGRAFTARDEPRAPKVVVVNEAMVRRFFPHGDALGRRIGLEPGHARDFEIVGVVRDVKDRLDEPAPRSVYQPVAQSPETLHDIEVRVAGGAGAAAAGGAGAAAGGAAARAASIAGQLRRAVAEVEPNLPVLSLTTMGEQLERSLARERAITRLTGFFGLLALLLAAIGLYGVMSYGVARRTGEIGLRMALGAERGRVLGMVLLETAQLVAVGVGAGLVAALALTRLLASQLFGVGASDPATVAVATFVMVAVALVAGFLPARRAADTEPMAALRYE